MSDFLARLEELDKAATPGPWFINQVAASPEGWRIRREGDNRPIIRTTENEIEAARAYTDGTIEDTYRLIVHLRNHVPEILALVKAAREVAATPCRPESRGLYCDAGHGRWPCAIEDLREAYKALDK